MTKQATPLSVSLRSAAITRALLGIRIVVADPDLEQIAEDVERFRARGVRVEEREELLGRVRRVRVEMHVGHEDARHARIPCRY